MIKAALIDLDGTLLDNDIQSFLRAYLGRLGEFMSSVAPADQFIPLLMRGTQAMIENADPARSLQSAFADNFYPFLGVDESELQPQLLEFYRTVFPEFRTLTRPRPDAAALVQTALDSGIQVVVATGPLFPRTAIEQRLEWADIPVARFAYSLLTSYEVMHSSKPRTSYYAEILGMLGVGSSEAVMIGNDPSDDLAPARTLGLAAFHVAEAPEPGYTGGSLAEARRWLAGGGEHTDSTAPGRPPAIVARLHGYLGALLTMTRGLESTGWARRPAPDSWSPVEIVCHLRDVEAEVNLPRLRTILATEDAFVHGADTDHWADERDYRKQSPGPALEAFVLARKEALGLVRDLEEAQWSRRARHGLLGPTSLREVVSIIADHDLVHLSQLRCAIAS
jgi:FMN phosphatase YigB (HAD superfamily)